jgi:hypothetical protein
MEQTANERALELLNQLHKLLGEKIAELNWVPELPYPIEVSLWASGDEKSRGTVDFKFRAPFNRIQMEKDAVALREQGCSFGFMPTESESAEFGYVSQSWWTKNTKRFVVVYDPKVPGSVCQVKKIGERVVEREPQIVGVYEFACE